MIMSDGKLTLDDIAALIVQIEPTDLADLARVRKGLNAIADSSPVTVRTPIAEALKRIDQMMGEKVPDPSGLLADAGAFIEEAMNAMETSGGEDPPLDSRLEQGAFFGAPPEAGPNPVSPDTDPGLLEEFITESRDLITGAE